MTAPCCRRRTARDRGCRSCVTRCVALCVTSRVVAVAVAAVASPVVVALVLVVLVVVVLVLVVLVLVVLVLALVLVLAVLVVVAVVPVLGLRVCWWTYLASCSVGKRRCVNGWCVRNGWIRTWSGWYLLLARL